MPRTIPLMMLASISILAAPIAIGQAGDKATKKVVPVDPETKKKLHAVFAKHCTAALERTTKALLVMAEGGDIEEMQRANKALAEAKLGMNKELDKLGISQSVRGQEWETWSHAVMDRAGKEYEKSKKK